MVKKPVAVKSKTSEKNKTGDFQEKIRKKAYELFEKNGRAHGRDMAHWLEAESIVKAEKT